MKLSAIYRASSEFNLHPASAMRMRVRFLDTEMKRLVLIDDPLADAYADECADEILKLMKEIDRAVTQPKRDEISVEQIERARSYPIEQLIEFDRQGKALAWCHEDKTPSLAHWKKTNRARCFPCDKTFNPIDVLIDRDHLSFPEAVRRLT